MNESGAVGGGGSDHDQLFLCVVEDLHVKSLCSGALRLAVIAARRLSPLSRSFCLRASAAAFRSSDILMKRIQRYTLLMML